MKELNEMTLDELKALELAVKEAKVALKATAKADKANVEQARVDACNSAIADKTLIKGSNIVILYKGNELTVEVATEPSVDRPTVNCNSLDFDDAVKDGAKKRYISKGKFLRVAV